MADTFFTVPDKAGADLKHRSATDGSSNHHPSTALFLFGAGTPVEAAGGSGVVTSGTQRVTLASDGPTVSRLGTNGDAASKTGSNAAQLRILADLLDGTTASRLNTKSSGNVFNSDLTLDTAAYTAGDSFCSLLTITSAVLAAGDTAILDYIHIVDVDDVGPALRIYFFDRSGITLPSNNAVWNVSDADMKFSRAMLQINAGDWSDAGGNRTATYSGLGYLIKPNSGTSIFMAAIIDSATTHTAAGINISIGFKY